MTGCGRKDDTRLIRELIDTSAHLAEAHRLGDLMEGATTDFLALPGNYNRSTTRGVLYRAFKFYGNFKIHFPQPTIRVDNHSGTAKATIHFILVRQDVDLPDLKDLVDSPQLWLKAARQKADLYQLKLDLIKSDKHWLVEKAHIQGSKGVGI
jgi:hypothetical protein